MNSVFNENEKEVQEIGFPVMAQSLQHGFIVLFTEEKAGTVIFDPALTHGMGYYGFSWASISRVDKWKILKGGESVTITQ